MKKIIVFESVHFTIKAEDLLNLHKFQVKIVSVPSYISHDCGMAMETEIEILDEISFILDQNNIKYQIFDKK